MSTIADIVNSKFDSIAPGIPEVDSAPALTTPIALCEVLVTGSTLCLVC